MLANVLLNCNIQYSSIFTHAILLYGLYLFNMRISTRTHAATHGMVLLQMEDKPHVHGHNDI